MIPAITQMLIIPTQNHITANGILINTCGADENIIIILLIVELS
jgi:hypothetical protein